MAATRDQPRTAFVLSGGGNLGVSQVGMLMALFERDIRPDVIVGTSIGAFNGAAFATKPTMTRLEHQAEVWASLKTEEVFPGGRFTRAWNLLRRDDHLFSNEGLVEILERSGAAERFEELAVPLRVVATDLDTGDEAVFAAGPLRPALLASAALPGLFEPINHDGRTLVDGAVVNVVPLWHALSGPVDRVYVMNVSGPERIRPIRSPLDVAVRAFAIARNQRFELEMRDQPPGVDVVVLPRPDDDRELFDFRDGLTMIDEARHLAGQALDAAPDVAAGRPPRRPWWRRRSAAL
jgi:NTE family protein